MERIAAPAKGRPRQIVDKMSAIVKKVVESKEWKDFTAFVGSTPHYSDPATFAKFVAEQDTITKEIMSERGAYKIGLSLRVGGMVIRKKLLSSLVVMLLWSRFSALQLEISL